MDPRHNCPLCADTYETESDLRVHLEVEHRKSELAAELVSLYERERDRDPVAEGHLSTQELEEGTPTPSA